MFGIVLLAIIILPFVLSFQIYPLLPTSVENYRGTKEIIALACAAAIFLFTIRRGKFGPVQNPWLLLLIGYLLIHPLLNPPYTVPLFNTNIGDFWVYKPLSYALIYFGMFWAVSTAKWSLRGLESICSTISWVGFLSAIYVLCQFLGLDQWQNVQTFLGNTETENAHLSGTFSHPNYAAAFLAISFPFAVQQRKWWMVVPIVLTVFLIDSKIASLSLLFGISAYLWYKNENFRAAFCALLPFALIAGMMVFAHFGLPDDKGRFALWGQLAHDIIHPFLDENSYPLTGYGLGAYRFIYTAFYQHPFLQAHFELLEFAFNVGLIGVSLLIFSIIWLLRKIKPFTIVNEKYFTFTLAFLISLMQSVGLFVWQIEPHRFYVVLFVAILHNIILKGKPYAEICLNSNPCSCSDCKSSSCR